MTEPQLRDEIARVRAAIPDFLEPGMPGPLAVAMMRADILAAESAMAHGNAVECGRSYGRLKEWG